MYMSNIDIIEFIENACECQLTNAEKEFVRNVEKRYKEHGQLCYIPARLGIIPRSYWDGRRQHDITDAIKRCLQVGKKIPEKWIEKYNELTDQYGNVSKTETLCASCTLKNEECHCDCTREYSKKEEDTADE